MANQGTNITSRLNFSSLAVNAAHTDGAVIKIGTSSAPLSSSTADMSFLKLYTKSTATSGDNRGLYWKHILGGTIAATGFGDGGRFLTSVTGIGYSYASGVHATLQIETAATVTGSGAGLRATLGAASATRTLVGALSALHVCSDVGANNTLPTVNGFIRFTDDGSVKFTNLFVVPAPSNGTVFATHTTQTMTHSLKIVTEAGVAYYVMCTNAATNRG